MALILDRSSTLGVAYIFTTVPESTIFSMLSLASKASSEPVKHFCFLRSGLASHPVQSISRRLLSFEYSALHMSRLTSLRTDMQLQ